MAGEYRAPSSPDGRELQTSPSHSQVSALSSPPNMTVTPRHESKAIEWLERGAGPVRLRCAQRFPSHSQVSPLDDPPNRTVTCRKESYAICAPTLRSGVSSRHTTHSPPNTTSPAPRTMLIIRGTVAQRRKGGNIGNSAECKSSWKVQYALIIGRVPAEGNRTGPEGGSSGQGHPAKPTLASGSPSKRRTSERKFSKMRGHSRDRHVQVPRFTGRRATLSSDASRRTSPVPCSKAGGFLPWQTRGPHRGSRVPQPPYRVF